MSDMKLIMENWRANTRKQKLNELSLGDFKQVVSGIIQLKKSIEAGEISAETGGKILASVVNMATFGVSGAGRNVFDALFATKKLGTIAAATKLPDKDTESNPFLDVFNVEDEYSKLLDDKIENAFLNYLSDELDAGRLDSIDLATWNINEYLEDFLKNKFNQKSVAGAPPKQIDAAKLATMTNKIKKSGLFKILKGAISGAVEGD